MKFSVRFKIDNRLGKASAYTLREICTCLVERYSLRERELSTIVAMRPGSSFANEDMVITRRKP